ncbi:lysine-rich nucleolar protein 1 isoform X2 [Syngnathoides biaculeatus]|uniref:lysine-rich nucleolar protein 1 isoform X2 n=1 Tax=Syngnathoides biaculeatus TaxID=300417 RepID=UPI002ADDCAFC|nr:lysine-rich nucleolar protein 1 isoform X2 [Syngnathoides biaculeatus]
MNKVCQTDEVVFISERPASKANRIVVIDQVTRLSLQRDIDRESHPEQLSKSNHTCPPLQRPEEKMKNKCEELKEENTEKKSKKRKKEQTPPPKTDGSTVADGTKHCVEKKKKKVKKEGSPVEVQECLAIGGELKQKTKRKKKLVNVSVIDGNGKEAKIKKNDRQVGIEKKSKKKTLIEHENVCLDEKVGKKAKKRKAQVPYTNGPHLTDDSAVFKKKTKKKQEQKSDCKKKKMKVAQIEHENICLDEKVGKKAKKRKAQVPYTNGSHLTDDSAVIKKKAKKKQEQKSDYKKNKMKVAQIEHENIAVAVKAESVSKKARKEHDKCVKIVRDEEKIKHKAKRKKDKVEQGEITVTKKKKRAKLKLGEREVATQTPDGQEVDKVKLKKKKKKNASPDIGEPQNSAKEEKVDIGQGETKRGKKVKKRKSPVPSTEEETQSTKKKKVKVEKNHKPSKESKRKSSVKQEKLIEEVYPDSSVMMEEKKGITEELHSQMYAHQADVVFLSEKAGNIDEVTINQERRHALQMEIDKASQPQQGFGQWGTAQFESSQQKDKFLRLMGGFKKSFQPAAAATMAKPNMALGKDAQDHLQQGLLGEFERAHSRRIDFNNRGAGLGFSGLSKKKFSIDVNTCRSVRFDD